MQPKITVIVVGKRHHVRFFPKGRDADRSGNCLAGTVVDQDITHPTEFDFYLQSHGGLIGSTLPIPSPVNRLTFSPYVFRLAKPASTSSSPALADA